MNFEQRQQRTFENQARMVNPTEKTTDPDQPNSAKNVRTAMINVNTVEMEGTFKSKLITSQKMCAMINKVMRAASPDFDGSRIIVNGFNIVCELFFCENPHSQLKDGQIKVIERRDAMSSRPKDATTIIDRYNRRNHTASQYELTEQGQDALSEFIPQTLVLRRSDDEKAKIAIDWGRAVTEDCEQLFNGRNKIYVKVQFDLNKFLRKVYGNKASDGSIMIYEITVLKPLDAIKLPGGNIVATKWQLNVLQLDERNVREAYEDSGLSPLQNTLNIIR